MVGLAIALKILGCTSEGPGPINVLIGGINDFMLLPYLITDCCD
jgi:hypothetical protein